jgi:hypothetical protein
MKINEKENAEESETEEEIMEEKPSIKTKRISNLDENEQLVRAIISLPEDTFKKLGKEAYERGVSKASIIRDLLNKHFAEAEKPAKPNPEAIINDEELEALINEAQTFWGGFQTVGEKGFFTKFEAEKWKFSDLTDEQFIALCSYLKKGYDGFSEKPSVEEFVGFIEELNATEEQSELLKLILEHDAELTNEDAKKTIADLTAEIEQLTEQ